jgi:hypothetical protein
MGHGPPLVVERHRDCKNREDGAGASRQTDANGLADAEAVSFIASQLGELESTVINVAVSIRPSTVRTLTRAPVGMPAASR